MSIRYRGRTSNSVSQKLEKFDVFNKVHEEYAEKTGSGGFLTLLSFILILVFSSYEIMRFYDVQISDTVSVDPLLNAPLEIHLDITFPRLRCEDVSVDSVDSVGAHQVNISGELIKTPLNDISATASLHQHHNHCGSCFGSGGDANACCNTCDNLVKRFSAQGLSYSRVVREAPQCAANLGCRVAGHLQVNKVAGNIHVALGQSTVKEGRHLHEFNVLDVKNGFDTSHEIHMLRLGDAEVFQVFASPLEGIVKNAEPNSSMMYHYHMKLVPTEYHTLDNEVHHVNQYSVTETKKEIVLTANNQVTGLPGVFFVYDFSPFVVKRVESKTSVVTLMANLFTVIGGVFACTLGIHHLLGMASSKRDHNSI